MALLRGLINSRKFVTYNRDEVTRAERQPLETRSDGLGAYLTPQQVGAVVLFLVENLTAPVDRRIGRSRRREDCPFIVGGQLYAGRYRLASSPGDLEEARLRIASKEEGIARRPVGPLRAPSSWGSRS